MNLLIGEKEELNNIIKALKKDEKVTKEDLVDILSMIVLSQDIYVSIKDFVDAEGINYGSL